MSVGPERCRVATARTGDRLRVGAGEEKWRTAVDLHRFGNTRRDVPVIGQGTWYQEDDDPATALAALPCHSKP